MLDRRAARADRVRADDLVAEPARHAERARVSLDRARGGELRTEAVEREREDGGAHLGAEALPLPGSTEPRARVDRPALGEVLATDLLHPDRLAVAEGDERQGPVVGPARGQLVDVMCDEALLVERVGPGHPEGHLRWIVDSGRGDRVQPPNLGDRGEPELEARRPQAQPRQRVGELRQEVAPADGIEAELLVEQSRPVVGERLEEHDVVLSARHVQCVLDDCATEAPPAVGADGFDILDLRGAPVAAHLAVGGDSAVDDCREEARRDGAHDQSLCIVQLRSDVVVAPRLRDGGRRPGGNQPFELHLLHHRGVDAPVRLPAVREHDVRGAHVPVLDQCRRERVVARAEDHPAVVVALHQGVGLCCDGARVDAWIRDREVVRVVDVRHGVGEEADPVCCRDTPLGGGELDGSQEVADAFVAHRRILAVRARRAAVRGIAARGRHARARARACRRHAPHRRGRAGPGARPGPHGGSGSCRDRASR